MATTYRTGKWPDLLSILLTQLWEINLNNLTVKNRGDFRWVNGVYRDAEDVVRHSDGRDKP